MRVRILRPGRRSDLISARVFEGLFSRHLGAVAAIRQVPAVSWHRALLDHGEAVLSQAAAAAFRDAAAGCDFLCPSYECLPLLPFVLALRCRARSPVRLLLIAHSPAVCPLEWALLRRLLRPGDRIVVPSRGAGGTLDLLCPALTGYVRVAPHPMHPLPALRRPPGDGLVALSRIHPSKLLHRLIEAVALLRRPGVSAPRLRIVGPLREGGALSPYARCLQAQIRRLGLTDRVTLGDLVEGEVEKAELLAGARMLVNLSVGVEESFGKSVVEALGMGVPVLATRWTGLRETVGSCGVLLPVDPAPCGLGVDVPAERIAAGLLELLAAPPSPSACRDHAQAFAPERVLPLYADIFAEALERPDHAGDTPLGEDGRRLGAAPEAGLLRDAAPLTALSWREALDLDLAGVPRMLALLEGRSFADRLADQRLRSVLLAGLHRPLAFHAAGLTTGPEEPGGRRLPRRCREASFSGKLLAAAAARGVASTRLACLAEALADTSAAAVGDVLAAVKADGVSSAGTLYLAAEVALRSGDAAGAFRRLSARGGEIASCEPAALLLETLGRSGREAGCPEQGAPFLRAWLARFPDAPAAAGIWLELCRTLLAFREPPRGEILEAFHALRDLRGDSPEVRLLAKRLLASAAVTQLQLAAIRVDGASCHAG
jgi:glycosyltransferase involved in cell wall biosynthesis